MNKDIEYYTFQYTIPIYKIKPPQEFCDYYQTHKDEIIVELDKEKQQLQQKINQLETNRGEAREYIKIYTNDYTEKLEMIEILYLLEILERGKE